LQDDLSFFKLGTVGIHFAEDVGIMQENAVKRAWVFAR
jgi:hypothetical protein